MEKPKRIVEDYMNGTLSSVGSAKDHQLQAAIGLLSAEHIEKLADAIYGLHSQIPVSVRDIERIIQGSTNKIIASNERLSASNESYARWMKWLTAGLVAVGAAQVILAFSK